MKKSKRLWDLIPLMLLWAMLCAFAWGSVFTFLTDTEPAYKLAVYVDAPVPGDTAMAVALEEKLPAPLRMVKVHPFTHAMMDSAPLEAADLYIVSESKMEEYAVWFCPLPEGIAQSGHVLEQNGKAVGLRVYDHQAGEGAAKKYIAYGQEDYYLCFGALSVHLSGNEGAADNEAEELAKRILQME